MPTMLRKFMAPLAAVLLAAGCSSGGGDDVAAEGRPADEICGAFAKDQPAAAAFEAIAGEGGLVDNLSEPERVVKELRAAALEPQSGKTRMKGVSFCWPRSTDGKGVFNITFREALAVPESADTDVTRYTVGESATSSDLFASIYFTCRMKAPAHEIVIAAELERDDRNEAAEADVRARQITVLNAAARKVSGELGCGPETELGTGVPQQEPGAG
ncbi:hypothetical protein [Streptomyces sp. SP18CS02]|uniref:hypothetical protein n=1 Tax=Streptomyces sp. SP18CS02 TaxID=3002531 RepID=UPI002E79765F|nr:hypothetical protein [Streptomyces sp. SP18CS02]MEE1752265.1 hypothetical protein [Streptomyces sp. SP18CS02]